MNTSGHVVTKEVADLYCQRQNELCDGSNPEEFRCEVQKVPGGYSVINFYWSVTEQRRIYLGACNIPAKF